MPRSPLAGWLKTAPRNKPQRCHACADPKVVDAIAEFAKAKDKGETLSWRQFHVGYLVGVLGWTGGYEALMNHWRNHVRAY